MKPHSPLLADLPHTGIEVQSWATLRPIVDHQTHSALNHCAAPIACQRRNNKLRNRTSLRPSMSWLLYLSAAPVALTMLLRVLGFVLPGRLGERATFAAFSVTAFLLLMVCASYGVFASIFLRAIGYGGLSQWTVGRAFKWTMWLTTGVTFRVDEAGGREEGGRRGGKEALDTRPAVFVGNHQT